MTNLNPSARLKVKADTFFLPDSKGHVYFRNNLVSFSIEGETIDQWIEKLIPVFNGEYTLEDLTDGLPDEFKNRLYEIAQTLYQNGFVRDVSQDRPHELPDEVVKKYASQIEFLDNFAGSGAYRFQSYRQAKVLAVGSGTMLVSLVAALLESGLPKFHVLVTDSASTVMNRLVELAEHARHTDPEVAVTLLSPHKKGECSWHEAVQPFDSILYVSQDGDVEELRALHAVCRQEKKLLLPAMCVQQVGLAGPLVHPDYEGCWESAWRRIHRSALRKDQQLHSFSSTAGAMLTNVIVFELLKKVTGVTESELKNKMFLLDLETLEGNWHSFLPHPLVTGGTEAVWVQDFDLRLGQNEGESDLNKLFTYFGTLTSAESGIFHTWEEGDLKQLPLAQCRVQPTDPQSEGPAELLPDIVCNGLTHEEARREAALSGLEAYVSRMVDRSILQPGDFVGVGAGETIAEGVCRGLHKCLIEEIDKRQADRNDAVTQVQLNAVGDERCRFYLQALTTMQGAPVIGIGEEVYGFPVVWVGVSGLWHGSAGLNVTMALRKALQQALLKAQNPEASLTAQALAASSSLAFQEKVPISLVIPASEESDQVEVLQSALQVLKRNGKRMLILDLAPERKEEPAGVYGVLLREEESR